MAGFFATRRRLLAAAVVAAPAAAAEAGATVRVLDCCGSLQLTLPAFHAYRKKAGSPVARFIFQESPSARMPDRIRHDPPEFDLVLTGADALIDGFDRHLWLRLFPDSAGRLPDLNAILSKPALAMQCLAEGQGAVTGFSPVGPLFNYIPSRVSPVPRTAVELLDWARAHQRRFTYPVPTLSEAGTAFLQSLPYMLGDRDPKDPAQGWAKTWSYLQELGRSIQNYAVSSGAGFLRLQSGTADICVSSLPDDLLSRMSTDSDAKSELLELQDFRWVGSAYYAAIPRTVAAAKIPVVLDVIAFLLSGEAQALAFARGNFYPGPALAGLDLDQASPAARALIAPAVRPAYARMIADHPIETPLAPGALRYALGRWSSQIGSSRS